MDWRSILPGLKVAVDGRAHLRQTSAPSEVRIESSFSAAPASEQIDGFMRSGNIPAVFVDADLTVWVLTSGGSGLITFQSPDANPMDDEQDNVIQTVRSNLSKHFGVGGTATKPKAKKKKITDINNDVVTEVGEDQLLMEGEWIDNDDSDENLLD